MGNIEIIALEPSEREVNLAKGLLEDFGLEINIATYDIFKNIMRAPIVRDIMKEEGGFSACIAFERWRFFNDIQRAQLITNIAYSLDVSGSLLEFSLIKEQALMLNTLLYTIRGWSGYLTVKQKRDLLCIAFQRIKERQKKMIARADLPLVRGPWL